MPTATTTVTHNGSTHISLKTVVFSQDIQKPSIPTPSSSQSSPTGSTATLRTLYNRATRAFLHRDIRLTSTLLDAAFGILQPPPTSVPDIFVDDRRKWDILRITLESTVYASTPSQEEQSTLPDSLCASLAETPHALISKLYARSLSLFTPADSVMPGAGAAYVPSQVVATLVLASLRVECADLGRVIIEEWLARRDPSPTQVDEGPEHENGYTKILDLYCLHVLPKLQQWDYAFEFLEYEGELSSRTRERLKSHLQTLHVQSLASRKHLQSSAILDASESKTPRPYSPAPSSSSSSLSTASAHTVVPLSRANGHARSRTRSPSSDSSKSDATARAVPQSSNSRPAPPQTQNGHPRSPELYARPKSHAASSNVATVHPTTLPRAPPVTQSTDMTGLGTYSLIKATIRPYLTTRRLATLFLLLVVLPLASWFIRKRRKAARIADLRPGASHTSVVSNAELVRRRLGGVEVGLLGRVWGEAVRAVTDTVKMAGSGLV